MPEAAEFQRNGNISLHGWKNAKGTPRQKEPMQNRNDKRKNSH